MKDIVYKLENQEVIPKLLDIISQTDTWMKNPTPFTLDDWIKKFDYYSTWGNNFKISVAYKNGDPVAFGTGLYSSSIPQWFYMQHFSIIETQGLSKIYLEHGIRLTDTLVHHGESLGYYSYIAAWGVKHNAILDKIYNSSKRDKNYFRYLKLFEWCYSKGDQPLFNTHKVFAPGGHFYTDTVFNNYVLRPEFRKQDG